MSIPPIRIPVVKRKKTSIRVDPAVWEPFVKACHAQGDSSCGVLEPYMFAYTMAVKKGVPVRTSNLTLNMTVNRITERERRSLPRGKEGKQVVEVGSRIRCAFCGNPSVWRTTRWPSPGLCLKEYLCEVHKWRLSYMVRTLGVEAL